jgi:quinol monooxygenase YgiN
MAMAVIVAGWLRVDPSARAGFLDGSRGAMEAARVAPGCRAFVLSADPVDPAHVRVFEQWDSVADVEAFGGAGPEPDQAVAIVDAEVWQHEIASSTRL